MIIEKAIAAALGPILDDVIALEKRIDAIALTPGPKGDAGADALPGDVAQALIGNASFVESIRGKDGGAGIDGIDGNDGAGIDATQYVEGAVYRKGVTVTAHLGQHFRALCDTVNPVDDAAHWQRVGSAGFRHRGAFKADAVYIDGDLFVNGFSTFCIVRGAPVLLAGRGEPGKQGEPGKKGAPGKDGATIIGAQVEGFKLVLVQESGNGVIEHIEADFAPAFNEALRKAVEQIRNEVAA